MKNLNSLFRLFVKAALGKGRYHVKRKEHEMRTLPFNLVSRHPEAIRIVSGLLGVPESELEEEQMRRFHEATKNGDMDQLRKIFMKEFKTIPASMLVEEPEIKKLISKISEYEESEIKEREMGYFYTPAQIALNAHDQMEWAFESMDKEDYIRELSGILTEFGKGTEKEQLKGLSMLGGKLEELRKITSTRSLEKTGRGVDDILEEVGALDKAPKQEKIKRIPGILDKLEKLREIAWNEGITKSTNWETAIRINKNTGVFKAIVSPALLRKAYISPRRT